MFRCRFTTIKTLYHPEPQICIAFPSSHVTMYVLILNLIIFAPSTDCFFGPRCWRQGKCCCLASLWCFIYFVLMLCAYVFFSLLEALTAAEETWTPKKPLGYVLFVYFKDFPPFPELKFNTLSLNINETPLGCHFPMLLILPLSGVSRSLSIHNSYHAYQRSTPIEHKKAKNKKEGTNNSTE